MKKNYFWGVFLILAGAYLVVSQLGYLPAVGVFSLLFTVVCIAVIVASIPHVHFGGILFPLAFIAIIYDKPLGITAITPWTVLLAALLLTIGLHLIFGRFRKKIVHRGHSKKEMIGTKSRVKDSMMTNWIFRQPLAVSSVTSHRKIFVMRK